MNSTGSGEGADSIGALLTWLGERGDSPVRRGFVFGLIGVVAALAVALAAAYAYRESAATAAALIGEANLALARAIAVDPRAPDADAMAELARASEVIMLRIDAGGRIRSHSADASRVGTSVRDLLIDVGTQHLTVEQILHRRMSGYGMCRIGATESQVSFAFDDASGGLSIVQLPWAEVVNLFLSAVWPWLLAVGVTILGVIPGALFVLIRTLLREARRRDEAEQSDSRKLRLLVRAQKLDAIGKLAAGITHDFNNSLMAIRGNAELLLDGKSDNPRAVARSVLIATERASEFARRLLVVSRDQQGDSREFSCTRSVSEFCQLWKGAMGGSVHLMAHLPATRCAIDMDEVQFHQVLLNLVVNAREAVAGRGTISVLVDEVDTVPADAIPNRGQRDFIRVSVVDDGAGMDPQLLHRVSEGSLTTRATGEASGLGLAVVLEVVTRAGGAVRVESEIGKRTCFEVYLPASARVEPLYLVPSELSEGLA